MYAFTISNLVKQHLKSQMIQQALPGRFLYLCLLTCLKKNLLTIYNKDKYPVYLSLIVNNFAINLRNNFIRNSTGTRNFHE